MSPLSRIALGLLPWILACEASDGEAHAWEWAGAFSLTAGETYTWSAERGESGEYADATMKLAIVHSEHDHRLRRRLSGSDDIEAAEVHAEELYELADSSITAVTAGSTITLGEEQMLKLTFADHTWASLFYLKPAETGTYVFFAEHFPVEFENAFHYLRDEHGQDVEPLAEEPDIHGEAASVEKNGSLGLAIFAALLTALPGILMIGIVALMVKRLDFKWWPLVDAFASGAILSCAVFLLLAEGLHLAGSGQDEVTGTWTWGTAIMAGWLVGVVSHHLADIIFPKPEKVAEGNEGEVATTVNKNYMLAVAGPVLFGDFVHNLVDGMVIGFAMKACSSSMTWTIVGVTIAHEAPQEVADFVILVTKAKMPWLWALLANASTAIFSVFLGAIISYEVDVSHNVEGIFLAFGAGVYIFVALTELGSSVVNLSKEQPVLDSLLRLLCFAVGAIAIGLCLINHEHCIAAAAGGEEGADPHAGHHHRLL